MIGSASPSYPPDPASGLGSAIRPDREVQSNSGIDLWTVLLDAADAEIAANAAVLTPSERVRAERFVFARDRNAFIRARAGLRHILASYLGISADRVPIGIGPFGKPELAAPCHHACLHFNLSHSGRHALVAVARGHAIGIDIEQIRPMNDLDGMAAIILAPAEQRAFLQCAADDRLHFVLGAWTRKEAYFKARGEGLARSPAMLECSALLGGADTIADSDDDSARHRWSVMAWSTAQYRAALAVEGSIGAVVFKPMVP